MIDVAARATNGVKIPGRKSTRAEIKRTFKEHLTKLKARLNVRISFRQLVPHSHTVQGPTVTGEVNLTCDAWQASNTDGYFAVTGHWIEETMPTQWELKSGLLGFTQLSNAHNGERLGQALYKIIKWVGIAHKVGWLWCHIPCRVH
jgi:hypothetical protein